MIRDLEHNDVEACIDIVRNNWGDAVADRFVDEIAEAFNVTTRWQPHYFVYDIDGTVVGFSGMMPSRIKHGVWDFIWVNVKQNCQNMGIGLQLTTFRISEVARLGGRVIHLVTSQPTFFSRFGFSIAVSYDGGWHLMTMQLKELAL